MQQPLLTNQMPALSAHQPINIGIAHVVWPQPANKRHRQGHNRWGSASVSSMEILNLSDSHFVLMCWSFCLKRNLSHPSSIPMSACRSPKMAEVVGQAVAGRGQPQREALLVESRRPGVKKTNVEQDGTELKKSYFKEATASGNRRVDAPREPVRDVAVLMADTPSPAPSVISIRSDLSEEDHVGNEGRPGCHLNQWVPIRQKQTDRITTTDYKNCYDELCKRTI